MPHSVGRGLQGRQAKGHLVVGVSAGRRLDPGSHPIIAPAPTHFKWHARWGPPNVHHPGSRASPASTESDPDPADGKDGTRALRVSAVQPWEWKGTSNSHSVKSSRACSTDAPLQYTRLERSAGR